MLPNSFLSLGLKATGDKTGYIGVVEALQYAEQNRQLREARMCKVCMDAQVDTVFMPCGHLVCCNSCSPRMHNCPICRKRI